MDNPEDLITSVESGVARLKVLYGEQNSPLTDNVIELNTLCEVIETILRHQQKEHISFWGDRRDYWHYLSTGVGGMKQLDDVVKKVQSLAHLSTGLGKGRALIRMCLSEQCLAECMQHALNDKKRTREWYNPGAMLLSSKYSSRLLLALYDLSDVHFNLYDETDLDDYWPSFQRKQFDQFDGSSSGQPKFGHVICQSNKDTTPDRSTQSKVVRRQLEHGQEEQASEVYVKQEVMFDLQKVEELVLEIWNAVLVDETIIPEISIPDLNHIPLALHQLKDQVSRSRERQEDKAKSLETKIADLELQVKDTLNSNEGSERDLLAQLREAQGRIKLLDSKLASSMNPDNVHQIEQEVIACRSKVEELENRNFELEEKILAFEEGRSSSPTPRWLQEERRGREAMEEQMEQQAIQLAESERVRQLLSAHAQHVQYCWVNGSHTHSMVSTEMNKLEQELNHLHKEWEGLARENEQLAVKLEETVEEHHSLQQKMGMAQKQCDQQEKELTQLRSRVSSHDNIVRQLQKDRDLAQDELANSHSVLDQETASLRFQLSTVEMELKQAKKMSVQQEAQVFALNEDKEKLQKELYSLKTHHQGVTTDKEQLLNQISEMKDGLGGREAELKYLQEQLTEATKERDRERAANLKIKNDFEDTEDRQQAEMKELNNKMQQLSKENEEIRTAFRRLLGQKVSLYQHADSLENDFSITTGEWIDSGKVNNCMSCKQQFTLLLRKHHCRMCGRVFCSRCCDNKVKLTISKEPVRVCNVCNKRVTERRIPKTAQLINTDDTIVEEPLSQSNGLDSDQRTYSMNIKDMVGDHIEGSFEQQEVVDDNTPPSRQSQYSIQREDGGDISSLQKSSSNDDDDYVVISMDQAVNKPNQFPVGLDSPAQRTSFDVDALRSKLSQLESVDNPRVVSPIDSNSGAVQTKEPFSKTAEVKLEGGETYRVAVLVDMAGMVIMWEFSTEPKGIAFGITCQRDETSPIINCLPIRRCSSHKTNINGEYVAQTAGLFTLIFDNSFSKFAGRTLSYKVTTKKLH